MDVLTFIIVVGATLICVILILLHPVWLTRILGKMYSDPSGAYAEVSDEEASDDEAINAYLDEVYADAERDARDRDGHGGYEQRRAFVRRRRTLRRDEARGALRVMRGLRPVKGPGAGLRPAAPTPPPAPPVPARDATRGLDL